MESRTLEYIADACGGRLLRGSPGTLAHRVCTDSRQAREGDVFFALPGERFDGHSFLADVAPVVAAAVVEQGKAPAGLGGCALIEVASARQALGRLAARYRKDFELPVIAVAGSNGKTTTKELLASVLRRKFETVSSEASFNNEIGVPLTLLNLGKKTGAAVLEAGTNHPGELAPLVRMLAPGFGVLTSIGREHLEFFGDVAGVAEEEGWLAELLPADGKFFINGDNEWAEAATKRATAQVVRVGSGEKNLWRLGRVRLDGRGVSFMVHAPLPEYEGEYRVSLLGRHQAMNALLALAVGAELGVSRAAIEQGLLECKPAKMRLQLSEYQGIRILDDAYNANADSMLAALQTLQELPCKGRRVAVLGDMAELGAHSESAHEEVGRQAARLGIGQLIAVGKMAPVLARGARDAGLNRVLEFKDVESAADAVKRFVKHGDTLLIKASRATRLERIAERLRAEQGLKKN